MQGGQAPVGGMAQVVPLEDINRGFELMHGGESIRGVVVY